MMSLPSGTPLLGADGRPQLNPKTGGKGVLSVGDTGCGCVGVCDCNGCPDTMQVTIQGVQVCQEAQNHECQWIYIKIKSGPWNGELVDLVVPYAQRFVQGDINGTWCLKKS